jgi:hypothetical protein
MRVGDGLRIAYFDPTPNTPHGEPSSNPHPAGLRHERGDGLRVAYFTQRPTRRAANLTNLLILQGLDESGGWLADRLSDPTPHTPHGEQPLLHILQGFGKIGDGLRVAYFNQRPTRRTANSPIHILQGFGKIGDGLRVAYFTQRQTRRAANPLLLILQRLG